MNRHTTLLTFLPRLAVGVGATLAFAAPAFAQTKEPAATLLLARPVAGPVVVRGSTPDATLPSFTGNYVQSVPAPNYGTRTDTNGGKTTWAGAKLNGLKDSVFGKPNPQDAKAAEPDSKLLAPPATNPIFGSGTPAASAAQQQPQQPPPGVYASPPAYRWYGWGGTTPGANPHSPNGVYPQGSANWYAQTGATPGAFPLTPVLHPTEALPVDAPAYAVKPSNDPPFIVGVPMKPPEIRVPETKIPEPKPRFITGPPNPEPRIVARTPIGPLPPSLPDVPMATPSVPSGIPVAIASSTEGKTLPAEPVAMPQPQPSDLNWQTAGVRSTPAKDPLPAPPAPITQPAPGDPAWAPASAPTTPSTPTVSVIRGQLEARGPQSIESIIRSACVGRVAKADVRTDGPGKLVVTFQAASESAAREAAALVAKVSELKPYEVTFEARIVPR